MDREPFSETSSETHAVPRKGWQAPHYEVISLSCEITSYAADDEPLF